MSNSITLSRRNLLAIGAATAASAVVSPSLGTSAKPHRRLGARAPERIDAMFEAWDRPSTPGLSLIVIEGGDIVLQRSYGRANIAHDLPWTPDMRHRIASISKQFLGALALKLHHSGKVALDEPVAALLPELKPFAERITLRHLLCHQGGMRLDERLMELAGVGESNASLAGMYSMLARQSRLNFAPGQYYDYNDSGSRAASLLLERATKTSLTDLAEAELFGPLEMSSTAFIPNWTAVIPNSSSTYRAAGDGWVLEQYLLQSSGDGGVSSSLPDMAKWWEQFRSNSLNIPSFQDAMTTPVPLPNGRQSFYGLGWNAGTHRGLRYFQHTGSINAVMLCFPDVDVAIVAKANRYDFNRSTDAFRIFDAVYPGFRSDAPPIPAFSFGAAPQAPVQRYVDRSSGVFIDIEQRGGVMRASLLGDDSFLLQDTRKIWRAAAGSSYSLGVRLQNGNAAVDMGEDAPRIFTPVEDRPLKSTDVKRWEGTYYSDDLNASLSLGSFGGVPAVQIGTGVVDSLIRPVSETSPDTLAGAGISFCALDREGGGTVSSLLVNIPHVRDVQYRRI